MGKYIVEIKPAAEKELLLHYMSGNKSAIKKIKKILIELTETPFSGTGNPEELKYEMTGLWSRRITQKDRLIYKVEQNTVTVIVLSAMGHYD